MSDPVDILARTAWAEARGEGHDGMQAVANVILNRIEHGSWWGHDVISVCTKPWQFSCWNKNDPNLPKLLAVGDEDAQFVIARSIAQSACDGTLADITNGADSYFDRRMATPPHWSVGLIPTAEIGNHRFFNTRDADVA